MRPVTVTVTGVADSPPIPVDTYINPPFFTVVCVISATATYSVQFTLDDPNSPTVWIDAPSLGGLTTNAYGYLNLPIRALRLHVTASTGTVTMTMLQSGGPGS